MSHRVIADVIDCLVTDEALRVRFRLDPFEVLIDLNMRGLELTQDEIDVLIRTDVRTWSCSLEILQGRVH